MVAIDGSSAPHSARQHQVGKKPAKATGRMSFLSFAEVNGLQIRNLIADGRWHRVPTKDHPKKRNGAYLWDGMRGMAQNWAIHAEPIRYSPDGNDPAISEAELHELQRKRARDRARLEARARTQAEVLMNAATWQPHSYLERKGFPKECGLVHDGKLIVPMWDFEHYGKKLNSAQQIDNDGNKKFLFGGKAKGSIYKIGSGMELWHCEGLATGLSIHAALAKLYRRATVVVSFSAGNLAVVAKKLGGYVVADHDESGAGERAAKESGLRWVMPADVGTDANDLHQRNNLQALVNLLRSAL
jgi:putative DNA primase/helicase